MPEYERRPFVARFPVLRIIDKYFEVPQPGILKNKGTCVIVAYPRSLVVLLFASFFEVRYSYGFIKFGDTILSVFLWKFIDPGPDLLGVWPFFEGQDYF